MMMIRFETKVQFIKNLILREVARHGFDANLSGNELLKKMLFIPKIVMPIKETTVHCCSFKDHAILTELVKMALGGDANNPNIIEVIETACDECPVG